LTRGEEKSERNTFSECRRQLEPAQEKTDGYSLASDRGTVHDLKLGDRLAFVVLVWCSSGGLPTNDG